MRFTSEAPALNTKTIYIPILDEGTNVTRPTQGIPLGGNLFRVLATPDYDSDDEHWKFPPGSVVQCVEAAKDNRILLIAKDLEPPKA